MIRRFASHKLPSMPGPNRNTSTDCPEAIVRGPGRKKIVPPCPTGFTDKNCNCSEPGPGGAVKSAVATVPGATGLISVQVEIVCLHIARQWLGVKLVIARKTGGR